MEVYSYFSSGPAPKDKSLAWLNNAMYLALNFVLLAAALLSCYQKSIHIGCANVKVNFMYSVYILLTGVIYTAVCPYIEINYIADQNLFKWHCNVQLYLQN